jgi:hypothetical protein
MSEEIDDNLIAAAPKMLQVLKKNLRLIEALKEDNEIHFSHTHIIKHVINLAEKGE